MNPEKQRCDHPGDIPAAEFRRAMHRAADLIADYLEQVGRYPVMPKAKPGDVRRLLPASPPQEAEPLERLLEDYKRIIEPNTTHWNHPGFMAYFPVTGSGPGILGEALAGALNVNAMLWRTGPAPTELEELACDWYRQMLGLPAEFRGHINDTASISSLLAIAAGRERATDLDIRHKGMGGRPEVPALTVYCSDQAHSSIDKACITLGIGLDNLRRIASDDVYRMRIDALEHAIAADKAGGRRPIAIVATAGTTSTTSVDPLPEIAAIARREKMWLHVDGAYAFAAGICPEFRPLFAGIEQADSVVTNPHKWLFVPVDCSTLFVRDPALLRRAFSIIPDYLTTPESGVTNLMDYGVQLGRRFRALKLWMVLRGFGVRGLQERIRYHCRLAQEFAAWVRGESGLELVAPVPFSTVCFRAAPDGPLEAQNAFNERLLTDINAAGPVFLSHTKLRGVYVLRLTVGNLRTTPEQLETAKQIIRAAHGRLRGG
ncbi:MAG: pyridoxal-dependent decarboxylase [Planctomycetota bacterium]